MNLDLYEILPEEISDADAAHLADIFMELAVAIESHYYAQIKRYNKSLEEFADEMRKQSREQNMDTEEELQDDDLF